MTRQMDREINNSKPQQIGIPYQILVGIDYACSKLYNNWHKLSIEHEGDTTFDKNIQIEVKHHYNKSTLGNRDEEFWKTLRNWLRKKDIEKFNVLILHTTKSLPQQNKREKSIFKDWNKNNETGQSLKNFENIKKRAFTKKHINLNSPETISFYKEIFENYDESKIANVISKIKLDLSQLNYNKYLKFIAENNPAFASIAYNREVFIQEEFVNWIEGKVKEKDWIVDNVNFFKQFYQKKEKYNNSQYSTYFDKYESIDINKLEIKSYFGFDFVKKLNDIDCPLEYKEEAISDYLRTQKLIGEINNNIDISFIEEIYEKYRERKVFDKLIKTKKIAALKNGGNQELLFYLETQNWQVMPYKNVITQDYNYFQRGTIQDITQDNENQFNYNWTFKK